MVKVTFIYTENNSSFYERELDYDLDFIPRKGEIVHVQLNRYNVAMDFKVKSVYHNCEDNKIDIYLKDVNENN